MRIEQLLAPAEEGKPWLLTLEDGQLLKVSDREMVDFSLYSGMELDEAQLTALRAAGALAVLREKAVSLLLSRPYSKGELAQRLAAKGATADQAGELSDWAERIGLLNEEGYARMIVKSYQDKGYGPYKIKDELYRRKIPRELWETALEELADPGEAIDRYLQGHLKSLEPRAVKKAGDALARRGFRWSDISAGIRRFGILEDES